MSLSILLAQTAAPMRALVMTRTPTAEQQRLLTAKDLSEGEVARWGLVLRKEKSTDYLVERSLWVSPDLSNSLAFYRFLESVDFGQPIALSEFPASFREQMLSAVNPTFVRFNRAPLDSAGTLSLRLNWSVTLDDGSKNKVLTVPQPPTSSRGRLLAQLNLVKGPIRTI